MSPFALNCANRYHDPQSGGRERQRLSETRRCCHKKTFPRRRYNRLPEKGSESNDAKVIQKAWEDVLPDDEIIKRGMDERFKLPYTLVAVSPAEKHENYQVFVSQNFDLIAERHEDTGKVAVRRGKIDTN